MEPPRAGQVYVRRWDNSFTKRGGSDGSLLNTKEIAEKNGINIWIEATPSGRVHGVGGGTGARLCPYTLRYPASPGLLPVDGSPWFENVYQAAKVSAWTPKHTQLLNNKAVFKRNETLLFADCSELLVPEITGRQALQENAVAIGGMLNPEAAPIRSQYPKHIRSCIIGSIDWDNLDGPLLGYSAVREKYGEQFEKCLKHSKAAVQLMQKLRAALMKGERILIAETDGPDLSRRPDYLRAGVEEFNEDGIMLVTEKAWEVVSADITRCFGHCWHIARLLLDLPNSHQNIAQLPRASIADCVLKAKRVHDDFNKGKASKAAATKKRKAEVLLPIVSSQDSLSSAKLE